jgi:hypothetical protein
MHTVVYMSAQSAHAQRSEPVDFVGIALIAYIAYKNILVAKT